jgi:hypothetical protein
LELLPEIDLSFSEWQVKVFRLEKDSKLVFQYFAVIAVTKQLTMAGVFDFDIDDGMKRQDEGHSDEDVDIEIQEDFINGPDIRAMNESIIREPGAESLVISEFTFRGKAGKAGPQGKRLPIFFLICVKFSAESDEYKV